MSSFPISDATTVSVNTPFFQSIRDDMGLSDEEAELVRLAQFAWMNPGHADADPQFDWFHDRPCNDGAEAGHAAYEREFYEQEAQDRRDEEEYYAATLTQSIVRMFQAQA